MWKIIIWHKKGDEWKILLSGITRSHSLANELKSKQDDFITATIGEKEYVIENVKRVPTHINVDDGITHLTLKLKECEGNIIRWHLIRKKRRCLLNLFVMNKHIWL